MNYRHSFHAGSFADVVKHAVLTRVLLHLRAKPAPFRVIDTHAGAGLYDLAGEEAGRSGEWRGGIERLLSQPIGEEARALLAPYLETVAALNVAGGLTVYPGSPALVRAFLRPQDRLVACELEPKAASALARYLAPDRRCKAVAIDGWTALNAYVPPKERRGLALIDPPFEDADDFPRLAQALEAAHRKWSGGTYLAWYPVKERAAPAALASEASGQRGHSIGVRAGHSPERGSSARDVLARRLRRSAIPKVLRAELSIAAPRSATAPGPSEQRLSACGLIVVNPPWTLAGELAVLLPALATVLSVEGAGTHRVDWLAGEK